eukprot:GHVU01219041.1.p1 GENE.GHVU01219041.1~~GHVU01219041.1.p1  ORF type:complete len:603 (+),score=69.92 GHVU01219041.1:56-1810(+)
MPDETGTSSSSQNKPKDDPGAESPLPGSLTTPRSLIIERRYVAQSSLLDFSTLPLDSAVVPHHFEGAVPHLRPRWVGVWPVRTLRRPVLNMNSNGEYERGGEEGDSPQFAYASRLPVQFTTCAAIGLSKHSGSLKGGNIDGSAGTTNKPASERSVDELLSSLAKRRNRGLSEVLEADEGSRSHADSSPRVTVNKVLFQEPSVVTSIFMRALVESGHGSSNSVGGGKSNRSSSSTSDSGGNATATSRNGGGPGLVVLRPPLVSVQGFREGKHKWTSQVYLPITRPKVMHEVERSSRKAVFQLTDKEVTDFGGSWVDAVPHSPGLPVDRVDELRFLYEGPSTNSSRSNRSSGAGGGAGATKGRVGDLNWGEGPFPPLRHESVEAVPCLGGIGLNTRAEAYRYDWQAFEAFKAEQGEGNRAAVTKRVKEDSRLVPPPVPYVNAVVMRFVEPPARVVSADEEEIFEGGPSISSSSKEAGLDAPGGGGSPGSSLAGGSRTYSRNPGNSNWGNGRRQKVSLASQTGRRMKLTQQSEELLDDATDEKRGGTRRSHAKHIEVYAAAIPAEAPVLSVGETVTTRQQPIKAVSE